MTILFLHGWGGDENSFASLRPFFENAGVKCIYVNFDCSPQIEMMLDDYVFQVESILKDKAVQNCTVIAHSFGARIAVLLAQRNPWLVKHMILTGAAGLKPRFNTLAWLRIRLYKFTGFGKGSTDYRKLSPAGKRTFQNIIKRDLSTVIAALTTPTMLIWGGGDKSTPLYMAKRWTKLNKTAILKVYKHAGHFCFLDDTARFIKDTWEFLNDSTSNSI